MKDRNVNTYLKVMIVFNRLMIRLAGIDNCWNFMVFMQVKLMPQSKCKHSSTIFFRSLPWRVPNDVWVGRVFVLVTVDPTWLVTWKWNLVCRLCYWPDVVDCSRFEVNTDLYVGVVKDVLICRYCRMICWTGSIVIRTNMYFYRLFWWPLVTKGRLL